MGIFWNFPSPSLDGPLPDIPIAGRSNVCQDNPPTEIVCGLGSAPDTRMRDAEFARREVIPRSDLLELLRTTLADVERVLRQLDPAILLEKRTIQGTEVEVLEAIFHVTEHFSMHTGQIFLLTKLLTASDLHFYDFDAGAPVDRWRSGPSGSI